MVGLLDANALIALGFTDHEHHGSVSRWWGSGRPFATCAITQGALIRYGLRVGSTPDDVLGVLSVVSGHELHELWSDDIGFDAGVLAGVRGHRQVTDAYLAALAESKGGVLVTFDRGIAELRPGAVELIA